MPKENMRKRTKQDAKQGPKLVEGQDPHLKNKISRTKFVDSRPYLKEGKLDWLGFLIGMTVLTVVASGVTFYWYRERMREAVRTPLGAPKVIGDGASLPASSPDRFWGTYRPQLYFGLKTRSPQSPLFGLMWFTQVGNNQMPQIRHWCDHGDGLRYGWMAHDGVNFGWQDIIDDGYVISTYFAKRPGGQHGGDWTAKVLVRPWGQRNVSMVSLMFYSYLDGAGLLSPEVKGKHISSLQGYHGSLGHYVVKFPKPTKNLKRTNYLVTHTTQVDQLKEVIMRNMYAEPLKKGSNVQYAALAGNAVQRGKGGQETLFVNQMTVSLPFEMEVIFESGSFTDRPNTFSGDVFQKALEEHTSNYDAKFDEVFKIHDKGFNDNEIGFAKATLSNLIGGVGYFYGASDVQSEWNAEPVSYWKAPLYSAVPSRSFFPRGFLWDEGFHNLLISKWNASISKDIIGHWLDLMNVEGWIPREQILGNEARAKVPSEFVVQRNKNANPPTFFLPLQEMVRDMIKRHNSEDIDYLKHIFPRLKAWFNWYNTTQVGAVPSSYRWRGRDANSKFELNPKTLTSGLDDSPRASHPTDLERHLDLRCWMALASGIMADIATSIGEPAEGYRETHSFLTDNDLLNSVHWSSRDKRYCDYGLHSDKVQLVKPKPQMQAGQAPPRDENAQKIRKVIREPEYEFINSSSYISLFPFLLKILKPTSENLGHILTDLRDPNLLWTSYGLRSLARNAPLYGKHNTEHDPPYWRGAIWINMNFLAVRALHHYGITPGPHQSTAKDLYKSLRANIIKNMYKQYSQTGFVWEQYDDKTGKGKGTHPFTGWSSLVVLMMAEKY